VENRVAKGRKPPEPAARNVKLVVEYDGTDFAGWQRQPRRRTAQSVIEEAIRAVTGEKASVLSSGRTDSGVHAEGHVVNFRTRSRIPAERLAAAINSNLDADVVVLDAADVPLSFHATHDARSKLYRYRIALGPVRPALDRRYSHYVRGPLDVAAMRRAARHLVGTRDFNSFRAEGWIEKNTVRTIESIRFVRTKNALEIYFRGTGFLYMMLRIIVGTLLRVGKGKIAPGAIPAIIAARDRRAAGPTAPPQGLCLVEVRY
jgi:tRNA pseudouridine38-40 synthase